MSVSDAYIVEPLDGHQHSLMNAHVSKVFGGLAGEFTGPGGIDKAAKDFVVDLERRLRLYDEGLEKQAEAIAAEFETRHLWACKCECVECCAGNHRHC